MEQGNPKFKRYFEKLYSRRLSEAEVKEYKQRLVGFFSLLIEVDQRNKRKEADEASNN